MLSLSVSVAQKHGQKKHSSSLFSTQKVKAPLDSVTDGGLTKRSLEKSHYFDLCVFFIIEYCVNRFGKFVYFLTVILSEASLNLSKQEKEMRRTHISLTAEAFCLLLLSFSSVIANAFIPAL